MTKPAFFKLLLCLFLTGFIYNDAFSQNVKNETHIRKPVIDSSVFGHWSSVAGAGLSGDGRYTWHSVHSGRIGQDSLTLQSTDGDWQAHVAGVGSCDFSSDSRWVWYPGGRDSLCLLRLGTGERQWLWPATEGLSVGDSGQSWLLYRSAADNNSRLIIRRFSDGQERKWEGVMLFSLDEQKRVLVWEQGGENTTTRSLYRVELPEGKDELIWQGHGEVAGIGLDQAGRQVTFGVTTGGAAEERTSAIWYYRPGLQGAVKKAEGTPAGVDSGLVISGGPQFSRDGQRIFFKLCPVETVRPADPATGVLVDIWHYRDTMLQSQQRHENSAASPPSYWAAIETGGSQVVQLERLGEEIFSPQMGMAGRYVFLKTPGYSESWWRSELRSSVLLEDARDGSKRLLKKQLPYVFENPSLGFHLTPRERYLVYYDPVKRGYFSYEISAARTRALTAGLQVSWKSPAAGQFADPYVAVTEGIAGMLSEDDGILVYDNYDIWLLDLQGRRPPRNITGGYGQAHHIRLRLNDFFQRSYRRDLSMGETLLLHGFNTDTKQEGFFRVQHLGQKTPPEQLIMDNCSWQLMGDVRNGEKLLKKVRADQSPNYYITKDFQDIRPISDVHPERAYNWLTAELINFPLPDGSNCQGILYKPEDFDPRKKYPLLLNYYDQKSDGLHQYLEPRACVDNINIPYFVSRGYLVFTPDIHYKIGYTGESARASIVSGAMYLSKKTWVDGKRMGIQGHSFGGYETNYVVTHSHLFAAAVEASGPSDLISGYNALYSNSVSTEFLFEIGQMRMRVPLWQRPDLYLSNSPVMAADKVTTPLLMMHNKEDDAVPYGQGLEMYLSLRRLGKRAWMLQYAKGTHAVVNKRESLDYTVRIEQFFDHYLKGTWPPKWMTEGIPAARKGIDTGFELDSSGRKP